MPPLKFNLCRIGANDLIGTQQFRLWEITLAPITLPTDPGQSIAAREQVFRLERPRPHLRSERKAVAIEGAHTAG